MRFLQRGRAYADRMIVEIVGICVLLWMLTPACTLADGPIGRIPPARDFAEFLAAQDLVFEGTLMDAQVLSRRRIESCGITGFGTFPATDIRARVTRVWQGVAEDSVLLVSLLGRPAFASGPLAPGTRLLVWAVRDCHDGWRLWGRCCVITPRGAIIGDVGTDPKTFELWDGGRRMAATYAKLDSAVTGAGRLVPSSTSLFEGLANVALLKVTQIDRSQSDKITFNCDSVGWSLGTGAKVPRTIETPMIRGCYANIFAGDSILVPIPSHFDGNVLRVEGCPSAFEVRNGFAVEFGVPLPFLGYALRREDGSLRVRPFLAKDE